MSPNDAAATPVKSRLAEMIGTWTGTTGTRFMPTDAFERCDVKATMRWVANGTFVLIEYDGAFKGEMAQGAAFYGIDPESGEGSAAWVDSFHASGAPMLSKGQAGPDEILNVMTTYGDPAEPWGWQTIITADGPNAVAIRHYNILPPSRGDERYVAIETILTRA